MTLIITELYALSKVKKIGNVSDHLTPPGPFAEYLLSNLSFYSNTIAIILV